MSSGFIFAQDLIGGAFHLSAREGLTMTGNLTLFILPDLEVPRPYVLVNYGPTTDTLYLVTQTQSDGVVLSRYEGVLVFFSFGEYELYLDVDNRAPEIFNFTSSETSQLILTGSQSISPLNGANQHAYIDNDTFTLDYTGEVLSFQPEVVNPDNDSLSFSILDCTGSGYIVPFGTTIDEFSGALSFGLLEAGRYNVCIRIDEWVSTGGEPRLAGSTVSEISFLVPINLGANEPDELIESERISYINGLLTVSCNASTKAVSVFDCLGRSIVSSYPVQRDAVIHVGHLNPGQYTIRCSDAKESISVLKFVLVD